MATRKSTADEAKSEAERLLDEAQTYAKDAGIRLADKPGPLYQLLVLTELLSVRISADIAVDAARELFRAGYTSPQRMRDAGWQDLVDALGRGHYRRYDESTATRLRENATLLLDRYRGDLRRLAADAHGDRKRAAALLQQFKGIGPTGADIFLREVQDVWPWVRPYFDKRALDGAKRVGLPRDADRLADLSPRGHTAQLAAALVRADLGKR
jgi:endonuclease III